MTTYARQDYKGWVVLKKTAGSGPLGVGTQVFIPADKISTSSPTNTSYPLLINADASISNAVLGKATPSLVIETAWKSSWASANLINSLVIATNPVDGTTDQFAVGIFDGVELRVFDGARCPGITVSAAAGGGPVGIQIPFMCLYDSKYPRSGQPAATSFSAPTVDAGYLTPISQVSFASTADLVTGVQLSIIRAQGYQPFFDQTLLMANIATGIQTGSLSISQSPTATTTPSSGFIFQIGAAGAGVQFAGSINLDSPTRNYMPSIGSMGFAYSLVDLSGNGSSVVVTAL